MVAHPRWLHALSWLLFWSPCLCEPSDSEVCASARHSCASRLNTIPVEEQIQRLLNRSYLVFRGAVPPEKVARAVQALEKPRWSVGGWPGGAQRVMEVLEIDGVFAEMIAELPEDVVQIADRFLAESWQLGSLHGHVIFPEDRMLGAQEREAKFRQALHSDFPYGHATREFGGSLTTVPEHFPFTLQLIWILSPFTKSSGSTLIYPGSHVNRTLLRDRWDPAAYQVFMENAVQVTGEPGDLVLYIGQAWHLWGVNEAGFKRMAVLGQVLPFFFKHMESHVMKTPEAVVRRMPPLARKRLGFAKEAWFRHPKRLLPFPRSPLEGAECLLDMLLVGYHGVIDLTTPLVQHVVANQEIPAPVAKVLIWGAEAVQQSGRVMAMGVLLAPLILWSCASCCCCCGCCRCAERCGVKSLGGACRDTALIFVGMTIGITLLLDRLAI